MTNLVTLFLEGDLTKNGFYIRKQNHNQNCDFLPPCPELMRAYHNWRNKLYKLNKYITTIDTGHCKTSQNDSNSPLDNFFQDYEEENNEHDQKKQEYNDSEQNLIQQFNDWLNNLSSHGILNTLENALNNSDKLWIRLITDDLEIAKPPWHSWDWIQTQKKNKKEITITFSPSNLRVSKTILNSKFSVLLVFGSLEDKKIQEEEQKLWEDILGKNKIKVLKNEKATRDTIYQEIRNNDYDLIYFSGHSQTNKENRGEFSLANSEPLQANNLINILRKKTNLKLVIFNSCDSLGFVFDLYKQELAISNIIAMRYIIHNQTSLYFLRELIQLFIKQGKPLHESLQLIRESLEDNQDQYATGSYLLPVLFQLSPKPQIWKNWFSPIPSLREFSLIGCYSFFVTILVLILRLVGVFESFDLWAYDQLMRLKPNEEPDKRILVVEATPDDIKNQKIKPESKDTLSGERKQPSLSDDTLKQLLEKLSHYEPIAIGLDIYRDFHVTSELKTELQKDYIFGVCKKPSLSEPGIKPSPDINKIGFVDAIEDHDQTLRRHILTSSPENSDCSVNANLSFLLGLYYLYKQEPKLYELYQNEQDEIINKNKNTCLLTLGKAEFTALNFISRTKNNPNFLTKLFQNNQGSYHNEDLKGCQIMLNYRIVDSSIKNVAKTVTLSQILDDEIPEEKIKDLKDRIILVGIVDSPSESNDYWRTPYSREEIAGVFIQAQMLSQILSAALDGRSLINPLLFWQDLIVIFACSFISSLTVYLLTDRLGKPKTFLVICGNGFLICVISFCLLLNLGIWLPLIPSVLVIIIAPITIWIGEIDFKRLEKRLNKLSI